MLEKLLILIVNNFYHFIIIVMVRDQHHQFDYTNKLSKVFQRFFFTQSIFSAARKI